MSRDALSAAELAVLRPSRLSNSDLHEDGCRMVEIVCDSDEIFVLFADTDGGDLTTLTEPGRFAGTWQRLAAALAGLPLSDGGDGFPRNEIALHLADGAGVLRWIGHGQDNAVYSATAAFGMNEERHFHDLTLTQVDATHPACTAPTGDWP
ncbi:hypothetical protein [Roseicyclus marinus]|uniref:hypothetical protein n=1 Tax=Roseicyclus marinus TaxID=2161673 RepID=UPI002410AB62|nr:hypothetical protein [Roseicyclus marinus]MDG3040090.1 hypothetical protein [Roseicyclus marinus]